MKKDDHEVEWSEHSAIYYIELAVQAEPAWAGISPVEAKFSDEGAGLVSSVYSLTLLVKSRTNILQDIIIYIQHTLPLYESNN